MNVTPRGYFSTPVDVLRTMLSNSVSFQKLCQVGSAAAALAFIYEFGSAQDLPRPHAVINYEGFMPKDSAGGSQNYITPGGKLSIDFEMNLKVSSAITAVTDAADFSAAALAGYADNFLAGLSLKMTTGAQAGKSGTILSSAGAGGALVLAAGLPGVPGIGDQFDIVPADDNDAFLWFFNTWGDIAADLLALSGTSGALSLRNLRPVDQAGRMPEDLSAVDYFGVRWCMDYGL